MADNISKTALSLALAALSGNGGGGSITGKSIDKISLLKSVDNVDTYRIYYTDGSFWDYDVTNGKEGFSPVITEKINTSTEYILTITNQTGNFDTPNLKPDITNLDIDGGIV